MSFPLRHSSFLSPSIQLYPDGDFSQDMELEGWARSFQPEPTEDQSPPQNSATSSKADTPLHSSLPAPDTPERYSDDSAGDSDTDTTLPRDLHEHLKRLCLTPSPRRYFGKSSGISLIRAAMSAKSKASAEESHAVYPEKRFQRRDEFWFLHPVSFPL
jgi:hypothetical protein